MEAFGQERSSPAQFGSAAQALKHSALEEQGSRQFAPVVVRALAAVEAALPGWVPAKLQPRQKAPASGVLEQPERPQVRAPPYVGLRPARQCSVPPGEAATPIWRRYRGWC